MFKVKRSTKFEKVISAFCDKKSWDVRSVKFLFDGQRIQPEQTPADFEMVRDRSASRPPAGLARASEPRTLCPGGFTLLARSQRTLRWLMARGLPIAGKR